MSTETMERIRERMKPDTTGGALKATNRRAFLRTAAAGAAVLAAPHVRNAEAARSHVWKVQSTWDAGTTGYRLFEEWAKSFQEKSDGELEMRPFPAKAVAADNNALFDAVRTGVLQGMNPFTLYWSGKIPASVFLSSYPAGPDQASQWDTLFYGLGLLEMTREIYQRFGLFYVGPIQHDANIIHSKQPVESLEQLQGMKIRLPGGMVAEVFEKFGVSTTSMPGSDIYPALEKGTIDAADYVGPGHQLGPRLCGGHELHHLHGPAGADLPVPARRPDGPYRQHGRLEAPAGEAASALSRSRCRPTRCTISSPSRRPTCGPWRNSWRRARRCRGFPPRT